MPIKDINYTIVRNFSLVLIYFNNNSGIIISRTEFDDLFEKRLENLTGLPSNSLNMLSLNFWANFLPDCNENTPEIKRVVFFTIKHNCKENLFGSLPDKVFDKTAFNDSYILKADNKDISLPLHSMPRCGFEKLVCSNNAWLVIDFKSYNS